MPKALVKSPSEGFRGAVESVSAPHGLFRQSDPKQAVVVEK
jgi:hypothetical protein